MTQLLRAASFALLALACTAFAACGSDDSTTSATASSGASSGAFPVTVEHKFGATEVPAEPKRVVTVGYTDQDAVLALGVVPVGVGDFLGGYDWRKRPWAQDALDGAQPKVVGGQQIDFEAVAAQRPDLIFAINAGLKKGDYERLSRIAPTVAQSGDYIDFGMPWDEQTLLAGRALGREERAREVVRDVEEKFRRAREEHPELAGKSAVLAYGGPDGYGAYATQDTRSRFLTDLGLEVSDEFDRLAKGSFYVQLSQERLDLIDRDVVLMYGPEKTIKRNPVAGRLSAVREDRVVYLDLTDQFAGALGFSSALSLPWLLDQAVPQLAAAADGDRATRVSQPQ